MKTFGLLLNQNKGTLLSEGPFSHYAISYIHFANSSAISKRVI